MPTIVTPMNTTAASAKVTMMWLVKAKLKGIIARFSTEAEPYRALVSPMWKTRYGDYDHLARVKEWSTIGDADPGTE